MNEQMGESLVKDAHFDRRMIRVKEKRSVEKQRQKIETTIDEVQE